MKVIFLDIDGVLNVCTKQRDEFGSIFHKEFVDNLRHIVEETNAKIVITSTWRFSGLNTMKEMWLKRNLPGEVIDITPFKSKKEKKTLGWSNLPFRERCERGEEIKDWLELNEVDSYCIIDDDCDFLTEQMCRFIQTSDNWGHPNNIEGYGLTNDCSSLAIQILNS